MRALPEGALRANAPVQAIAHEGNGWRVTTTEGAIDARAVVVALPAPRAYPLLRPLDATLADELAAIRFESTAIVLLAFDRAAVAHPLDGYGLLIPRAEGGRVTACGFFSTKFPGRAPAETVTLRAFLGSSHDRTVLDLDDERARRAGAPRADAAARPPRRGALRARLPLAREHAADGARARATASVGSRRGSASSPDCT